MKKFIKPICAVLLATTLLMYFQNCGDISLSPIKVVEGKSTQAGNPFTQQLLYSTCSVLAACHSNLTFSQCQSGVLATSGIDIALGLPGSLYPTFNDVVNAEAASFVVSDPVAGPRCLNGVGSLTCNLPSVQGAYKPQNPDPFSGVAVMISLSPGSCSGALSLAPTPTPTPTPAATPTATPNSTPTPTPTATPTATPNRTPTPTPTVTVGSPSPTPTPTPGTCTTADYGYVSAAGGGSCSVHFINKLEGSSCFIPALNCSWICQCIGNSCQPMPQNCVTACPSPGTVYDCP